MPTIGIYYGSSTGNTAEAAQQIKDRFDRIVPGQVTMVDVLEGNLSAIPHFDKLILGIPTWDFGNLQTDWDDCVAQFTSLNLAGTQVALFGFGDEGGYPDTYQDAMGILAEHVRGCGAELVGYWSTAGYDFAASLAVEGEWFVGLALDDENAPELTNGRIAQWVEQVAVAFGIVVPSVPVTA